MTGFWRNICIGTFIVNCWLPFSIAAEITVFADPDPAYLSESFQLTFEAKNKIDAQPDFSPLRNDFEMIGTPSHNSSYSYRNGIAAHSTSWTVSLIPRRVGNMIIPPIYFGRDASPALPITVLPASAVQSGAVTHPELLLEVEVTPTTAYVQAQVLYIVRILRIVELTNANLTNLELAVGDALIEKLGDDRTFRQRHNGRIYDVIERRYAVFPQRSGTLKFKPITLQGQIMSGRRSVFGFNTAGPVRRVRSVALEVDVKAIPPEFPGPVWLPAEDLELRETWSSEPEQMRIGEPVTRTVALIAAGLTASQLPELMTAPSLRSIRQYPDQPTLNNRKDTAGLHGHRQEKLALVPVEAGKLLIPELAIPWWNTTTDRLEVARLPSRQLNIPAPLPLTIDPEPTSSEQVETATVTRDFTQSRQWFFVTLGLTLAWFGTLGLWWWTSRRDSTEKTYADNNRSKIDLKTIRRLCESGELQPLKASLLEWGEYRFPATPPRSLGDLGQLCGVELQKEITVLNTALYGRAVGHFDGQNLWQALQSESKLSAKRTSTVLDPLQSLYP